MAGALFANVLAKAYHRFHKYAEEIFDRFGEGEVKREWWRKFMVDSGPKKHWVLEKTEEHERKRQRRQ